MGNITLDHKAYRMVSYLASHEQTGRDVPTQREIAAYIGLQSPGSVYIRLLKLQIAGYISREEGVARSIKVTTRGYDFLRTPIDYGMKSFVRF